MEIELEKFKDTVPYIFEDILLRFLLVTSDLTEEEFQKERSEFVLGLKDYIYRINHCEETRQMVLDELDQRDFVKMAIDSGLPEEEVQKMREHRKKVRKGKPSESKNGDLETSKVIAVDFTTGKRT